MNLASQCNLSLEYGGNPSSNLGRGIRNLFIHLFALLNMVLSLIIVGVIVLVILIYVLTEVKRTKHKLFALFLIALILFGAFSFYTVFNGKDLSVKSVSDVEKLGSMYFSWLGNVFNNVKIITTNAIQMNWQGNKTS